jgi:hypothetical protein
MYESNTTFSLYSIFDGLKYQAVNFFTESGKNIKCIFTSAMKHTIIEFVKTPKTAKILSEVAVWRLREMYILIG